MNYIDRQRTWERRNKIKPGSLVTIKREAKQFEDGWGAPWNSYMSKYINTQGKVVICYHAKEDYGIKIECFDSSVWFFPYYVLSANYRRRCFKNNTKGEQ